MSFLKNLESLSREELLALLAELQYQVAELTASNESLRSEIAQLKRSTQRQVVPFNWLIVIGSWALLASGFWVIVGGPRGDRGWLIDRDWLIEGGRRLMELVGGWRW
jgi:hypothetical protein